MAKREKLHQVSSSNSGLIETSFDIQEIQGDKNHAKAITKRNGKIHEVIIFAYTEEDFEKLQDFDADSKRTVVAE